MGIPEWAKRPGDSPMNYVLYTDGNDCVFAVPPNIRTLLVKPHRGQTFNTALKNWLDTRWIDKAIYEPPTDPCIVPSEDCIGTTLTCKEDSAMARTFTMKGVKINSVKLVDKYMESEAISDERKLEVCMFSKGAKVTDWKIKYQARQASSTGDQDAGFKAAEKRVRESRTEADGKSEKRQSILDSRTVVTVSAAQVSSLNYYLGTFLLMCALPFSLVDNAFFRHFIRALSPAYEKEMPHRTTMRTSVLDDVYVQTCELIEAKLDETPGKKQDHRQGRVGARPVFWRHTPKTLGRVGVSF